MATDNDRWSRGAHWLQDRLEAQAHVRIETRPGGHDFPPEARDRAYTLLQTQLQAVERT